MINAVIFDLDGTLIDTEKYFRVCWPETFKHFGYKMTDEQYLSIRSLGRPFVQQTLKEYSGDPDFNYNEVVSYRSKLMEETISEKGLQLKKGAVELLSYLKEKGIIIVIATASPVDRSERYLKMVGILEYFDRIISARNMKEGKPSPDVYSFACKELGFLPENCIAIEDSPNGVLSAYRAGCKVIMVPDQDQPDENTTKLLYAQVASLDKIIPLVQ